MTRRILRMMVVAMAAVLAASSMAAAQQRKASPPNSLRVYVMDCGRLDIPDVTPYQLKKEDMATTVMSVPCFLVAHPKGTLMWEIGRASCRERVCVPV